MKKQKNKVDKGFRLWYFGLSYRRKFIRTLWLAPLIILVIWYLHHIGAYGPYLPLITLLLVVSFIAQAVYNYRRWQSEQKNSR